VNGSLACGSVGIRDSVVRAADRVDPGFTVSPAPREERYDSAMTVDVTEEALAALPDYARVPIVFTVDRVFDVDTSRGFALAERCLDAPFEKDYDAIASEGPLQWARRFDLSNWAIFIARCANAIVGGATLAFDTPGLTTLDGLSDVAVLWDIRVSPDARRNGVGSALFQQVESRARLGGCRQIKVETQNTNVQACRFYQRQGCELRAVDRAAYPGFPEEIQLLWY
jgi:ribosomal protein S18 acetylase RimI-like enzyme